MAWEHAGTIFKFDSSGNKFTFASGLNTHTPNRYGPNSLAFDSSGNLYASLFTQGMIVKFDSSGNKSIFALGLGFPDSLVFDSSGYLYAVDRNSSTIEKFDASGNKSTFASGSLGIRCLAFDSQDNLYVSYEEQQNSIMKYDPSGNGTVFAVGPDTQIFYGLAFGSGDNLYVANYRDNVITKFDSSGSMSTVAGVQSPIGIAIQIPNPPPYCFSASVR